MLCFVGDRPYTKIGIWLNNLINSCIINFHFQNDNFYEIEMMKTIEVENENTLVFVLGLIIMIYSLD